MKKLKLLFVTFLFIPSWVLAQTAPVLVKNYGFWKPWCNFIQTSHIRPYILDNKAHVFMLFQNDYYVNPSTDLLLHLDRNPAHEATGHYTVVGATPYYLTDKLPLVHHYTAFFQGEPLNLKAGPNSLFVKDQVWGNFSIEFWLYSKALIEGETIFSWHGFVLDHNKIIPQKVKIYIHDHHLVWFFENMFYTPEKQWKTIIVSGHKDLKENIWTHHLLRFNQKDGLLEYNIDPLSSKQASQIIQYARNKKHPHQIWIFRIGNYASNKIQIGQDLFSLLSEFRISKQWFTPVLRPYNPNQNGSLITAVIDLKYWASTIKTIQAIGLCPHNTAIIIYYKLSDARTIGPKGHFQIKGPWIPFNSNTISNIRGRYLQIKLILAPEGLGLYSPVLEALKIKYIPTFLPEAPSDINVQVGSNSLHLMWLPSASSLVSGYKIYIGNTPTNYLQFKPIDVKNSNSVTISELKPNHLYYIRVIPYALIGHIQYAGQASKVISVRMKP